MQETIARAINPVAWLVEDHLAQREETLRAAVRVLTAMREPPIENLLAGVAAGKAQTDGIALAADMNIRVTPIWQAVIDDMLCSPERIRDIA